MVWNSMVSMDCVRILKFCDYGSGLDSEYGLGLDGEYGSGLDGSGL